ncbi:T9SS type A sorting domain-containing protein [Pontibacter qinzhouensis]|uniref:T9SS type A sorting domain-containing protein n=1 Tax=Pontibacter qinzhouensis TaxID=2603253 RepID=A0A5C8IUK3_9BACT|nr:PQQ-dependent sugar dehydrogenase [Pontibacter qinzhouensis]TXK24756.1 T9SS type A sorting domain-containing protein [Pontibacter qinzhouensis]
MKTTFTLCLLLLLSLGASAQYQLQDNVYPALTFTNLVELVPDHPEGEQLYAVTQAGIIYTFPEDAAQATASTVFLDITQRVTSGGERGLLGLAFHPEYPDNGFFYVNYTTGDLVTRISRFSRSSTDAMVADPTSEVILLTIEQPFNNHNGGKIAFGPDGYLYISSGDGGGAGDPQNNAQNRTNLLGKILRLDVDTNTGEVPYGIPEDNPFAGNTEGYRQEIFAYGLRNPWKFSFDRETGFLYAADVGQSEREEINLITNGGNYGWNRMEGTLCYPATAECSMEGLTAPIFEYESDNSVGRSITGGFVYRGEASQSLAGKYVYGDYVTNRIWALTLNEDGTAGTNELLLTAPASVSGFAESRSGELLVILYGTNTRIARLTDQTTSLPLAQEQQFTLYPNPATGFVTIDFKPGTVLKGAQLILFNALGQKVQQHTDLASEQVQLNVSGLAAGVYVLQVESEKKLTKHKVVIR